MVKLILEYKRLGIAKAILNKKINAGGITISYFKLYYRTIVKKNQHDNGTKIEM
jgi:hypothetical protein